jgi:hypothetical protein
VIGSVVVVATQSPSHGNRSSHLTITFGGPFQLPQMFVHDARDVRQVT